GCSARDRNPSANRTVLRMCSAQYEGSVAWAGVIQRPVTFEMKGVLGGLRDSFLTRAANASRTGATMEEWKAREVGSSEQSIWRVARRLRREPMSSLAPETTHWHCPFTAARSSRPFR